MIRARVRQGLRSGLDRIRDRHIETSGVVVDSSLYENPEHVFYLPSSWFALRRGLRGYRVTPQDVFADFGAGKGRVVYQAARMPFGRVLGIELDPELTRVAQGNIDRNVQRLSCSHVELVTADVSTFAVPDDLTVAFVFNSVQGETFTRLMDNLVASLDRCPRRLRLIYAWPLEAARVEATGRFRQVAEAKRPWEAEPSILIYESR